MAEKIIVLAEMEMKPRAIFTDGAWRSIRMAAFMGATDEKLMPQFGIGLVDEKGSCHFWALAHPHLLVTAWRGCRSWIG